MKKQLSKLCTLRACFQNYTFVYSERERIGREKVNKTQEFQLSFHGRMHATRDESQGEQEMRWRAKIIQPKDLFTQHHHHVRGFSIKKDYSFFSFCRAASCRRHLPSVNEWMKKSFSPRRQIVTFYRA
jgi:hypothetical protein